MDSTTEKWANIIFKCLLWVNFWINEHEDHMNHVLHILCKTKEIDNKKQKVKRKGNM